MKGFLKNTAAILLILALMLGVSVSFLGKGGAEKIPRQIAKTLQGEPEAMLEIADPERKEVYAIDPAMQEAYLGQVKKNTGEWLSGQVSYQVVSREPLAQEELDGENKARSALKDLGFRAAPVTEGCRMTVDFDCEKGTLQLQLVAMKADGSWYLKSAALPQEE